MNTAKKTPQGVSFFVPIGIGVLVQMACAGLVTAVTAIGFSSSGPAGSSDQTPAMAQDEGAESADSDTQSEAARSGTTPLLASSGNTVTDTEPDADAPMGAAGNSAAGNSAAGSPSSTDLANTNPADSAAAGAAGNPAAASSGAESAAASGDAPQKTSPSAQAKPLDDVRARSRILTIAGEGIPDELSLCQILVTDVAKVEMELLDGGFSKPREVKMELEKQPMDGQSCSWRVRQVSAVGFDRVQQVGEFQIRDQQLRFRWQKDADKGKLPFCRLKISADADTELCELWSPVRAAALKVNLEKSVPKTSPFVPPGVQLPPAESLRLDFTLEGWPEHESSNDKLRLNESADVVFADDDYGQDLLRIQLSLKQEGGHLTVQSSGFTTVPKFAARKGKSEIIYEEQPLKRSDLEKLVKDMAASASKYEKEVASIDKDLERLDTLQENLDKQLESGFRQDLAAKQDLYDRKAEDLAEKKIAAEEFVEAFSGAHKAMEKLTELCSEIEENGRIHFQLVRPLEDGDSDIVVSSSVNAAATSESP